MVKKKRVPIIFEDDAIIVCEKPAGMPVQSDHTRDLDVLTTLKHHIFEEQAGEEEPYLTVVHRLDRPVGGLMVLAKTKEAAASLSKQIQEFEFEKNYQAVVCGNLKEDIGTFEDYLLKNGKTNKTEVVKAGTPDAKKAELDYELIDCIETKEGILTWVLVILHTGRHHQIRVQMAGHGLPLWGDNRYHPQSGGTDLAADMNQKMACTERGSGPAAGEQTNSGWMDRKQIALAAWKLTFTHPETGKTMTFSHLPEHEIFSCFPEFLKMKEEELGEKKGKAE